MAISIPDVRLVQPVAKPLLVAFRLLRGAACLTGAAVRSGLLPDPIALEPRVLRAAAAD